MDKKKRLYEFDILKGYLVLFVLTLHLLTNFIDGIGLPRWAGWQLPLFFLVSAYFMKVDSLEQQKKKRLRSVAAPLAFCFLLFSAVVGIWCIAEGTMTLAELGRSMLSEALGKPCLDLIAPGLYLKTELHTSMTTFWYYIQFIIACVICMPLLKWINESVGKAAVSIAVLLSFSCICYGFGIELPFYLNMTAYEAAVMVLGNMAGKYKLHEKIYATGARCMIPLFFVSFVIASALCLWNPGISFMSHGMIGSRGAIDPLCAFIQVAAGGIAMLIVAQWTLKVKPLSSLIRYFGDNMLDLVLLHMFVAWILYKAFGLPVANDYVHTDAFTGSLAQCAMITGIFILNMLICAAVIWVKKTIVKNKEKRRKFAELVERQRI